MVFKITTNINIIIKIYNNKINLNFSTHIILEILSEILIIKILIINLKIIIMIGFNKKIFKSIIKIKVIIIKIPTIFKKILKLMFIF